MDKVKGIIAELQITPVTQGESVLKGSNELSALQGLVLSPLNTNISLENKLGCIFTKVAVLA